MRSKKAECLSMGLSLVPLAAVLLCLPYRAFDFTPKRVPLTCEASAAFVFLTAKDEVAALKRARTAWQDSYRMRDFAQLPLGDLPEEVPLPKLTDAIDDFFADYHPLVRYMPPAYVPSSAAPAPERLPEHQAPSDDAAFSRRELLGF